MNASTGLGWAGVLALGLALSTLGCIEDNAAMVDPDAAVGGEDAGGGAGGQIGAG
ncbi:MAG: hypothetical protein H6704_23070 [Myxococcales bacterium]|nr:hypothetical protein [Myxococcales bacterium]